MSARHVAENQFKTDFFGFPFKSKDCHLVFDSDLKMGTITS